MFFLLSLAFLAGLRDGNLKSTSSRLLTVLVLTGDLASTRICDEYHVGCATTALQKSRSAPAEVARGLPTLVRDFRDPNCFILCNSLVTAE